MNCSNCPSPIPNGVTLTSTCGSSFLMFMGILETFLRKQCDLEDPCNRIKTRDKPNSRYDFIVIGSGSAGSVIASRLSEESFSVLLLEAGLDEPTWTQVPLFFLNTLNTNLEWNYTYEIENGVCSTTKGVNCYWPTGKVLGGTSSINGMLYVRGSQKDFNDWEKMGNRGWSFKDVLPFFKKSENNLEINAMDTDFHSQGGPLHVTRFNYQPPIAFDILKAANDLGYSTVDINGNNHTGFAIAQCTTFKGKRLSTARAFLRPARNRKNLHIMLNTTATRIIFNGKTAVGVELYKDGKFFNVSVDKEVIISGGIVNSPQLLLNSGIGPREDLEAVGVSVVHHLPGVGKNVHDQITTPLFFSLRNFGYNNMNWATALEYLLYRTGPLSAIGLLQTIGFINTKYANPQNDHPDVQLMISGDGPACGDGEIIKRNSTTRQVIGFYPVVVRPKSRGYIKLRNSNPLSKPHIYPNFVSHPDDIAVQIEGIKFTKRLGEAEAFKKYDMRLETTKWENCNHLEFESDSYWECVVRENNIPAYHQVGSCKMGPDTDPMAVVDHQLRVKGVRGVRVADASIMPQITSGNPHAPTMMIGERAADFVKTSWKRI